jgi:hypothetical protein
MGPAVRIVACVRRAEMLLLPPVGTDGSAGGPRFRALRPASASHRGDVEESRDQHDQEQNPRREEHPRKSVAQALAPPNANLVMPQGIHFDEDSLLPRPCSQIADVQTRTPVVQSFPLRMASLCSRARSIPRPASGSATSRAPRRARARARRFLRRARARRVKRAPGRPGCGRAVRGAPA